MRAFFHRVVLAGLAVASVSAVGQMHKVAKPEQVVRAVGVYEWTGDMAKPTASRLIPVSVFIDGKLQDAGVYIARPVPFALLSGNVYELQDAGVDKGVLDLSFARHMQSTDAAGASVWDDGWFGYGSVKPMLAAKAPPKLKASKTVPVLVSSAGVSGGGHPTLQNKTSGAGDASSGASSKPSAGTSDDPDRPTMKRRSSSDSSSSSSGSSGTQAGTQAGSSTADTASANTSAKASASSDDPDRPTMKRRSDSSSTSSTSSSTSSTGSSTASSSGSGSSGSASSDDPDRPTMKRRADSSSDASASTSSNSGSGGTSADDPDRPVMKRRSESASGSSSGSSGTDSSNARASTSTPADDPDRPTMKRRTSGSSDSSAGTSDSASNGAPADDPDRPTLKRHSAADTAKAKANDVAGVTGGLALNDDPDRPNLHRGKPKSSMTGEELPRLMGLPPETRQMVAVSDAVDRDPHEFVLAFDDAEQRAAILKKMQAMAQAQLAAYGKSSVGAAASVAAAAPIAKTSKSAVSAKSRKAVQAAAVPAVLLTDEQLKAYTLSYGGAATYVYSAHTAGTGAALRYVTIVAQADGLGELKPAIQSVTDAAHLDRTPRMRFIDVVDAEANNRASLLFELRGQESRQFGLYRVIAAHADQIFVTGTTE